MNQQQITDRNRANAQKSTGPTSDEGKKKVSQNARRLGLFVSDGTLEQEDPQELAELIAGYTADYVPRGCVETELVRQLSMATHRLRRLERVESAAMFTEDIAHTRHEASLIIQERFRLIGDITDRVQRARTLAERAFTRTYKELEYRKANREIPRAQPDELEIQKDSKHEPLPQSHIQRQIHANQRVLAATQSQDEIPQNKPTQSAAFNRDSASDDRDTLKNPPKEAA